MEEVPREEKTEKLNVVSDYLEMMRSLPEHQRKIFAAGTMVVATCAVFGVMWFSSAPLHDIGLPSVGDYKLPDIAQRTNLDAGSGRGTNNPQMAGAIEIPHIGPLRSFIDSFDTIKSLIVPQDLHTTGQSNVFETLPNKLSQFITRLAINARLLSEYSMNKTEIFLNYVVKNILSSLSHALDRLLSYIKIGHHNNNAPATQSFIVVQ